MLIALLQESFSRQIDGLISEGNYEMAVSLAEKNANKIEINLRTHIVVRLLMIGLGKVNPDAWSVEEPYSIDVAASLYSYAIRVKESGPTKDRSGDVILANLFKSLFSHVSDLVPSSSSPKRCCCAIM